MKAAIVIAALPLLAGSGLALAGQPPHPQRHTGIPAELDVRNGCQYLWVTNDGGDHLFASSNDFPFDLAPNQTMRIPWGKPAELLGGFNLGGTMYVMVWRPDADPIMSVTFKRPAGCP